MSVLVVDDVRDRACDADLREDGWPLCPYCDGDELYSLAIPATRKTISGCYRCGPMRVVVTDPDSSGFRREQ